MSKAIVDARSEIIGDKRVIEALNKMPGYFSHTIKGWLKEERSRMLGGKGTGSTRRKGFREILENRSLRRGRTTRRAGSKWSRQVSGLFKGYIPPKEKNINRLYLKMGVISRRKHQMVRALEMLQTGGTISSNTMMTIPIYKNIMAAGHTGKWYTSSHGEMMNAAFRAMVRQNKLTRIEKGGRAYYFLKSSKRGRWKGTGFRKKDLMFIGLFGVRIKRYFTGRYDFYGRWDRTLPAALQRGQRAVDKATRKIERMR